MAYFPPSSWWFLHLYLWRTSSCAVPSLEASSHHSVIWRKDYWKSSAGRLNWSWDGMTAKSADQRRRLGQTVTHFNIVIWTPRVVLQVKIQELQSDHMTPRNRQVPLTACIIRVISGILRRQNWTRFCTFPGDIAPWNDSNYKYLMTKSCQ